MKKRLIIFILAMLSCIMIFTFDLVACSDNEDSDKYSLYLNGKSNVLIYQSAFDFDEYFSDAYILKTTESGEEFFIPLTEDMFASDVDTSSVGDKRIDINYNSKSISFEYFVKYKVEFLVDGQVFDTQLVLDKTELILNQPTKDGFTFTGWQNLPQTITDNVQVNATFSKDVVVPQLLSLNAEYGDTLQDLILPSNEFGSWQFVDDLATSVGGVGNQTKAVQFVLTGGQVFGDSTMVNVVVSKKTLQFKFSSLEYEYDGTEKQPDYYFESVDKEQVSTIYVCYQGQAVNVGEYEFEYIIEDDNYQGEYSGEFRIIKKQVKVKVNDCQMTYLQAVPNFYFIATDARGNALDQSLIKDLTIELDVPMFSPVVGEYEIGLKNEDFANFDLTVEKGKLTVNKATHDVIALPNTEQVVYGNTLSQIELSSSIINVGSWTWVDDSIVISDMLGVSAIAKFTPTDQDNFECVQQEVVLSNVLKRTVEINVVQSEFTYNANEQVICYSVNGILSGDESEYEIISPSYTNVGTYNVVLTLKSNKYQAEEVNTQLIINKASIANFKSIQDQIDIITYDKNKASELSHIGLPSGYTWKENANLLIGKNNYEAIFTPEDKNNYNIEQGYIELHVEKAQHNIRINQTEFNYNQDYKYEFKISLNHEEQTETNIELYYQGQKVESLKDAGEYSIKITCTESEHYSETSKTIVVQILAVQNTDVLKEVNAIYLDTLSKFDLPYNETGVWSWKDGENEEVGNAGKQVHKAVFTPYDAVNYTAREVDVEFNVSKKVVGKPTLSQIEYTYSGLTIKPNVNGTVEYFVKTNNGGIKAGNYSVVLELTDSDNYVWSNTDNATITLDYQIVQAKNSWISAPGFSKEDWEYGDTSITASYQAQFGDVAISYIGVGNDYNSEKMPTNAGLYNAVFTVVGTDDYTELSQSVAFTINKKKVDPPTIQPKEYNGEVLAADVENNLLYTIVENAGGIPAGEYEVKLKLTDSDNYRWSTSDNADLIISFVIYAADENVWTVAPKLSKETWSYGEDSATINEYKSRFGDVAISFVGTDNGYNSTEMPKNAGSYKAVFIVKETADYAGLEYTVEFTITKQIVYTPQVTTSAVYTGEEIVFATAGDNYTVSGEKGTSVGNYTVVLLLKDSANYKWSDTEEASVQFDAEITKAQNGWKVAPKLLSEGTWTYGEDSATLNEYECKFGDVAISYKGTDNGYNSAEMPTSVGTYKIVFTVDGTDNFTDLIDESITFTIEKIKVFAPQALASKSYTGEHLTADISTSNLYTIQNNGGINAGNYNVVLTLNDSTIYKWADGTEGATKTLSFTIEKIANEWLGEVSSIEDRKSITYGQTIDLQAKDGNVKVSAIGVEGTEYSSQTVPEQAGNYQITVYVDESTNYTRLEKTFKLEIKPFQLIIKELPAYNDAVFYENVVDVADIKNMQWQPTLNKENIAGTFSYNIELGQALTDIANNVGKVKVAISFTPDDSRNYIFVSEVDDYATITVKAVAKIGDKNYGSIESALFASKPGDIVWVLAGEMQAVIASDCTIPAGVTLNIPHTDNDMNVVESDGSVLATLSGGKAIAIKVLTTITINPSVTLTNNGTLQIAGQLSGGAGGHPYAGHTTGNAAKLVLGEGATINSVGGTIKLFGLIVEEEQNNKSKVIVDGGSLSLPFVVRDFGGGNYMYQAYLGSKVTAFNEFELRNITAEVTVKNSANVYGYANLRADDKQNATRISLVSTTSDAVIHFANSSGYLTFKYNIVDENYYGNDSWANGIMDINVFGGAKADPMSLTINYLGTHTVTTENVFFPLSWRLNVSLYNGIYTMKNKYKLMPGAVFVVGKGATLNIGTLTVYTQDAFNALDKSNLPWTVPYRDDAGDAKFIIENGGIMNVSTAVGGEIVVKQGGTFTNNGASTVTSYEGKHKRTYTLFSKTIIEYTTQNVTMTLTTKEE